MPYVQKPHKLKPYDAVDYTNGNHTLKPGDAAIAVTTCTGRGNLLLGKYIGTRKNGASWRNGVNVLMEVRTSHTVLVDANDEPYDFALEQKELPCPAAPTHPGYGGYGTLYRYGSHEYNVAMSEYREAYDKWSKTEYAEHQLQVKKRREGYEYKKFPATRIAILQNNNIYPATVALSDVTL